MRAFSSKIQVIDMSMEGLTDAFNKYSNLASENLFLLYEHGFVCSPSEYNEASVRSVLVDLMGEDIKYICSNLTGDIDISDLRIKYALTVLDSACYKDDLKILYKYLNAKKNLEDISEAIRISSKFNTHVKPLISMSQTNVGYRCKINFSNPVIVSCIAEKEGYKLKTIDFRLSIYKKLCTSIRIPTSVIKDAILNNKSLFIDGITLRKELDFLPLLISGDLYSSTKWGSYLEIAVINYYKQHNDTSKTTLDTSNFDFSILQSSYASRVNYLNATLTKLGNNYIPACISIEYAYVFIKGVEAKRHVSIPSILPKHVGGYVIDNFGNELSYINFLRGISGEFLSAKDCKAFKLKTKGLPIEFKSLEKRGNTIIETKQQYYNISQLSTKEGESIESCVGSDYSLFNYSLDYVVSVLGTTQDDLRLYYYMNIVPEFEVDIPMNQYKNIISELAYIFTCAKCGVLEPKLQAMNRSYYTEDLILKASYEAEKYVRGILGVIK